MLQSKNGIAGMEIKKDISWRVYLSFLGIVALGFIVIGKAFYIQRVQGHFWTNMDSSMHLKYLPIEAERGTIYSEDGNMLSTSIPVFDVYVDFAADGLREKNSGIMLIHSAFACQIYLTINPLLHT